MSFLGKVDGNEKLIKRFMEEYDKSLLWYKNNPKEAAKLVVETLPMLKVDGLADSIPHVNLQSINAKDSQKDLEFFFEILKQSNPKLIGGKLPESSIYF